MVQAVAQTHGLQGSDGLCLALGRFFDTRYEAKNECDMVTGGRRCRPDRVVVTPTETWVVDFKTGTPTDDHKTQVLDYCAALRAMGYPQVSGYLIYLIPDISVVSCQ